MPDQEAKAETSQYHLFLWTSSQLMALKLLVAKHFLSDAEQTAGMDPKHGVFITNFAIPQSTNGEESM